MFNSAKIAQLTEALSQKEAELATFQQASAQAVTEATTQLEATHATQLEALRAEHTAAVEQLREAHTAALTQAATGHEARLQSAINDALASAGVAEPQLPGTAPAGAATTEDITLRIDDLNKQIEAEDDPRKKGALAQEVWDLMKQSAAKKKPTASN